MKTLDVNAVISFFGGGAQLASDLNRICAIEPKIRNNTVHAWNRRKSIPGKYQPLLLEVAEDKNKNFDIKDFMK